MDTEISMSNQSMAPEAVVAYLRDNPDFLQQHTKVWEHQQLNHRCGNATSLVERQVMVLRQRIQSYGSKLSELLQTARRNDIQFEKTKRLVTELSGCTTVSDMCQALTTSFIEEFHANIVCLVSFGEYNIAAQHQSLLKLSQEDKQTAALIELFAKQPWSFCQPVKGSSLDELLAQFDKELCSCAIIPIHVHEQPTACVIVASTTSDHYTQEMDTLFLNHVAAVCSRVFARLVSH
jgi:hypothetical protein